MNDDEKILYADEIAQLMEISVEELHENMEQHAPFISDYQHFHQAVEAMQEDLEQYDQIEHRAKRLALLVTYFTADWTEFERSYFVDICKHIESRYTGEENAHNSTRTTH
jgi:FtsZ-binding cell division protein ZapB